MPENSDVTVYVCALIESIQEKQAACSISAKSESFPFACLGRGHV